MNVKLWVEAKPQRYVGRRKINRQQRSARHRYYLGNVKERLKVMTRARSGVLTPPPRKLRRQRRVPMMSQYDRMPMDGPMEPSRYVGLPRPATHHPRDLSGGALDHQHLTMLRPVLSLSQPTSNLLGIIRRADLINTRYSYLLSNLRRHCCVFDIGKRFMYVPSLGIILVYPSYV